MRLQIEPAPSQQLISPSSTLPLPYKTLLQTDVLFPNEAGLTQEVGFFRPVGARSNVGNTALFLTVWLQWKIAADPPASAGTLSHTFHTDAPQFPTTLPFDQDTGEKDGEILHFFPNSLMFSAHAIPSAVTGFRSATTDSTHSLSFLICQT